MFEHKTFGDEKLEFEFFVSTCRRSVAPRRMLPNVIQLDVEAI